MVTSNKERREMTSIEQEIRANAKLIRKTCTMVPATLGVRNLTTLLKGLSEDEAQKVMRHAWIVARNLADKEGYDTVNLTSWDGKLVFAFSKMENEEEFEERIHREIQHEKYIRRQKSSEKSAQKRKDLKELERLQKKLGRK